MKLKPFAIVFTIFFISMIFSGICSAASEEMKPNEDAIKMEHTIWSKNLDDYPLRPPIVYKDTMIIITGNSLMAFESTTGDLKWLHTTVDSVQVSSPVIVDKYICYTKQDTLYVLEVDSGQVAWSQQLQKDPNNLDLHSLAAYDHLLLVIDHDELKAIDVNTQNEVWVQRQSELPFSVNTLLVSGEDIFIANIGSIFIYKASTGENIKSWKTDNIYSSMQIWQDMVIAVGTFGEIEAFDIEKGELEWKFVTNENVGVARSGIAFGEHAIYITNHKDGFLYAINPENGTLLWSKQIGNVSLYRRIFNVNSIPTYHNQVIYIGRWVEVNSNVNSSFKPLKGEMLALDSTTGETIKSYPISRGFTQAPIIIDGNFLILPASGSVGEIVMIE